MSQDTEKKIVKSQGGFFNELMIRIKLVLRLMADPRVNLLYKAIPVASLAYLIIPTDLIPLVPIDDALVIWLATYLFVELAPADVVQEHLDDLRKVVQIGWDDAPDAQTPPDENDTEIIDAEFQEVKE
jgi:hypothetical protein